MTLVHVAGALEQIVAIPSRRYTVSFVLFSGLTLTYFWFLQNLVLCFWFRLAGMLWCVARFTTCVELSLNLKVSDNGLLLIPKHLIPYSDLPLHSTAARRGEAARTKI